MYSTFELCQLGECIMPVHVVMLVCVHRNVQLHVHASHAIVWYYVY